MIASTELKNGVTFLSNGKPRQVIKYQHIKVGRGGATVRVTARNLETGGIEEITYSSNVKVEDISTQKRKLQYLYNDGNEAFFMDPKSYEQISIPLKVLGDDVNYIKEGGIADVLFWDSKALSIDIPPKVTLKVEDTAPGVKGNTASNIYKPAKLENGLSVKVPLFIKVGDKVRVDTRSGDYVERVTS